MRRVTFSRNYTLSLSRTCQCHCKYCAFATHRAHIHDPAEVEDRLDEAVRRNAKELLVLTGERPEVNSEVAARLGEWGHEDFTSYVVWACQRALERGLLPHTNLGVLSRHDLDRLREVTASQGLMLESINPDLIVHQGSPTKHPERRLETIRLAGELRIPFTTGILVGIGESEAERFGALAAIAEVHAEHGHIQEVILQNFVPHPRYYGREVADIADQSSRERWTSAEWKSGIPGREAEEMPVDAGPLPDWATPITVDDMKRLIAESKRLMPDVGVQVPPNLADWWPELVDAGATDLGGLSSNGDHISPDQPFPSPHQVRKEIAPRAVEKGRRGDELTEEELTALFSETRPAVIEEMRAAADELRGELAGQTATFVVNRNINFTNVCVVGCAFCGFGQGKRSPDAYHVAEDDFQARVAEAVDFGATEICMQGGIHPDYTLEHYGKWLRLAKEGAPRLHLHAYSPMEVHYMCERSGRSPAE